MFVSLHLKGFTDRILQKLGQNHVLSNFFVRRATSNDLKIEVKQEFGLDVSSSCIRRHRKQLGFIASKPVNQPFIREQNKVKRLAFCRELKSTEDTFSNVIFTDESSVQLGPNHQFVITKIVRDAAGNIVSKETPALERVKHPLKVHVWGGISRRGATQLVIFNGIMDAKFYTETILQGALVPAIKRLFPAPLSHRFWQDNDPKHCSNMAKNFMLENNINWFKTPPESPDLNVIENVWAAMKRYVGNEAPRTQDALVATILRFWNVHVTVEQCNRYINHIYKVIPRVIAVEGGFSGY